MKINTKKIILIVSIIFLAIVMVTFFVNNTYAAIDFNPNDYAPGSMTEVTGGTELEKIGNRIIGALRTIGSAVSVIVLMVIGIKYMMGSVEEKAEYKKTMTPYVIGAFMVFGITNIIAIIIDIVQGIL